MRLLLIPTAAMLMAANWMVDYDQSKLSFDAVQEGAPFTGTLPFTADITFDPETLKGTNIAVTIHVGKADAGTSDRNETLRTKEFFNLATFPAAAFTATEVTKSDKEFIAQGELSINGIRKPLALPFTLTPEGENTRVKGEATISRKMYDIGTGEWANEDTIADAVIVKLDLLAVKR